MSSNNSPPELATVNLTKIDQAVLTGAHPLQCGQLDERLQYNHSNEQTRRDPVNETHEQGERGIERWNSCCPLDRPLRYLINGQQSGRLHGLTGETTNPLQAYQLNGEVQRQSFGIFPSLYLLSTNCEQKNGDE